MKGINRLLKNTLTCTHRTHHLKMHLNMAEPKFSVLPWRRQSDLWRHTDHCNSSYMTKGDNSFISWASKMLILAGKALNKPSPPLKKKAHTNPHTNITTSISKIKARSLLTSFCKHTNKGTFNNLITLLSFFMPSFYHYPFLLLKRKE